MSSRDCSPGVARRRGEMRRAGWIGCLALACAAGPTAPVTDPAAPAASARGEAAAAMARPRKLVPFRDAGLTTPAVSSAAALDAAAEAAERAGVLDVAAYWRAEALALESSPRRTQALAAAREAAGYEVAVRKPEPLDRGLARALRAAVEDHAWDQVLALTGPALASEPHHELYLWTGDALWQLGREVDARRMWSRARVLLRAAGVAVRPRYGHPRAVEQLGWSSGGLVFVRDGGYGGSLEVWGDRLERPWRRWRVPETAGVAWMDGGAVVASMEPRREARAMRLVLRDPANGATLVDEVAYAGGTARDLLAGAEAAPVLAASTGVRGEVKVWTWTREGGLVARSTHASAPTDVLAIGLDAAGERLAIGRSGYPVEIVELATGTARMSTTPAMTWTLLRFLDDGALLAATDQGDVLRVDPPSGASTRAKLEVDGGRSVVRAFAASSAGLVAGINDRRVWSSPGEPIGAVRLTICDAAARCETGMNVGHTAAFSPTGDRVVSGEYAELSVQDLAGMLPSRISREPSPHRRIAGVAADGSALAVEDRGRGLVVWDTRTGERPLHGRDLRFLGFAPDSRSVAVIGAQHERVEIHPLAGGPPPQVFETDDEERIHEVAFSPDGRRLAIVTAEQLGVWDTANGAELWRERTPRGAYDVVFTGQGELLYGSDVGLHVRDAAGRGRPRTLQRQRDGVHGWTVSPDWSEVVACVNDDVGSRVLAVRTGRVVRRLPGVCGAVFVAPTVLIHESEVYAQTIDLRTGQRRTGTTPIRRVSREPRGPVALAGAFGEPGALTVLGRDGEALATILPREELGWVARTEAGAVDGDPAAHTAVDTRVGDELAAAALGWDGMRVPGLLSRVFAGEVVGPPASR